MYQNETFRAYTIPSSNKARFGRALFVAPLSINGKIVYFATAPVSLANLLNT